MWWLQQKAQVLIRICITILNTSTTIQSSLLALGSRRRNLSHRCSAFIFPRVRLASTTLFRRSNSSPDRHALAFDAAIRSIFFFIIPLPFERLQQQQQQQQLDHH
jgi:hypothetical protein